MKIQISAKQIALWTATIIIVVLAFQFLWLIRNVLFLIFLSVLLATGIEPIVNWLRRGPFSRSAGILVVYTGIFGLLALVVYLTVPPLVDEVQRLIATFADRQKAQAAIDNLDSGFFKNIARTAYDNLNSIIGDFHPDAETISVGLTVAEAIFSAVTVFVVAFYWLTERTIIKRFIFSLVPEDKRPQTRSVWTSVEEKLGAWVRGQLILMLFIGVLCGIGYTVMGLKFALALAVFAAIAELIPLVGPYIGGAPAVLVALTQGLVLAIVVLVFIVVLQLVEGNLLVPRIMERAVGVTPLTVIVGILVGSTLAGVAGALIAVPIAASIQVIFNNILSYGSEQTPDNVAEAGSTNTDKAMLAAASTRVSQHNRPTEHIDPGS